jgi:catechol 2,3-dioxygenase-like lactoylglutathione lyase family enzyme
MTPFKLRKIDHVVLRVRDLQSSLRFYVEALGCTPEKTQDKIGLYQIRAGDSLIDLIPIGELLGSRGGAAPGKEGRNVDHFAIQVAPFDEPPIRAYLASHGVEIDEFGQRYGAEGEGPSVYIRDPDGNTVELKGPVLRAAA